MLSLRRITSLAALCALVIACNDDRPNDDILPGDTGGTDASDVGADASSDVNPQLDVGLPTCTGEDALSYNHDADSAADLGGAVLDRDDLFVCPGFDDWYRVDATAGQRIRASISFSHREGDLDLYLLPGAGTLELDSAVSQSATQEDEEAFAYEVLRDGTFYVVVDGFEDASAAYAMTLAVSCGSDADCADGLVCSYLDGGCIESLAPICGDDADEANDVPSSATPVDVTLDEQVLTGLAVCEDDDDWRVFELSEPTSIEVILSFDRDRDLNMGLFDDEGRLVQVAATADQQPEILRMPYLPTGTWYLVVDHNPTGLGNDVPYTLEVFAQIESCSSNSDCTTDGRQLCEDGGCVPYTPSAPAGPGELCDATDDCEEGLGCFQGEPGIDDNFCTANCESNADCAAFVDGYCLDLFQTALCFDACTDDDDCPSLWSCDAGSGRCELDGCFTDDDCAEGQLCRRSEQQNAGFCTSTAFAGCGDDDDFEPNDTDGSAEPIEPGDDIRGLMICDDNDDWFVVDVETGGTTLEVEVEWDTAADIDVYLFDAFGNTVGAATDPDANPEVAEGRYLSAGTYLVRVNQFPGERDVATTYDLSVSASSETCTVEGDECLGLNPLRIVCNEDVGACEFLEGDGAVEPGGFCDSTSDCTDASDFCWNFELASEGRNICTRQCGGGDDCADVPGTVCQIFGRGFGACLPE